jgi:ribosome-binding factor A
MTHRIAQINQLIRREVSQLLQREVKDPRLNTFVTITEVVTSPDLRYAKVFVSHLGNETENREILKALTAAAGFLRNELARRLKLRRTPELIFRWDDSIEHGNHILNLIDQVTSDHDQPS